jgi:hypothetical protein
MPCLMTMIQERQREVSELFGNATEPFAEPRAPVIAPKREPRHDESGAAWVLDAGRIV